MTVSTAEGISATGDGSAAYAGGIAGKNSGTIESGCNVTLNGGSITATSTNLANAGGIAGIHYNAYDPSVKSTIKCGPVNEAQAACSGPNNDGIYTATISFGSGNGTADSEKGLAHAGTKIGFDHTSTPNGPVGGD